MKKIDFIMSVPNRRSPTVTTSDVKIKTQHVVMTCILAVGKELKAYQHIPIQWRHGLGHIISTFSTFEIEFLLENIGCVYL